ncbi:MAG: hypothetical protein VX335_01320, partial [Pseudomonadota bacterium]|nr:hypothetical protein [Pseudomonadota bacterium]
FNNNFMGLMLCLSHFLPTSIAWMLLCHFSDGVEYSSGIHFGNNLMISVLFPLSVINGGLAIHYISWSTIGMAFLSTSLEALLVLVPILIVERFFVLKSNFMAKDADSPLVINDDNKPVNANIISLDHNISSDKGLTSLAASNDNDDSRNNLHKVDASAS